MFGVLGPQLDERQRRLLAGAQARALGRGGVAVVARTSGMSNSTVHLGIRENEQGPQHLAAGQPVISVDTKKKEVVGNLLNKGREWQPKGAPVRVDVHDFPDPTVGKAIPYGVYDLGADTGWVSVGDDHDTASFAVATIRRWWQMVGKVA